MVHTPITPDSDAGQLIERLGYAGLIPFVLLALFMWIVSAEAHPFVAIALSAYGATIASFLGGIHWGMAIDDKRLFVGVTDLDAGTTVNVGIVSGGTRTNVFAGAAHADIDVRVRSQAELERVDAALKALTTHHPDATVTLSGDWNRPVMPRTDAGGRLFELARQAGADLGQDIGQTSVGGASDGNFAVGVGAAVLDGFGAVGDGAHARHEHIRVSGMLDRTALAALVLHRLA